METFNEQIKEKTNDELAEIYINKNDYQLDFYKAVENELNERGIALAPLDESRINARKINDEVYKKGLSGNQSYIIFSFIAPLLAIFALFFKIFVPILFLIPLFSGIRYWFKKRTDPYRINHYYYDEQTRKYGKWLFILGCVTFVLYVILKDIYK